jgi:hypothetical protein
MHDGWESVVAAYGLVVLVLAVWFWMILAKLRRSERRGAPQATDGGRG